MRTRTLGLVGMVLLAVGCGGGAPPAVITPAPQVSSSDQPLAPTKAFHTGIKYLAVTGLPDFKGHETWDNTLTLTHDSVFMAFTDTLVHAPGFALLDVKKIQYGQAATRHVGRWVALGVLVAPLALFGLFHKSRHHFIAITYDQDGQEHGVYLEANKDLFRDVLNTLAFRSRQPIYADEKDLKWLLTQGVSAQLEPQSTGSK